MASGSLEATALALLAIFLYQVHRRTGLVPLLFLLAALSLLVPFTSQASSMDFGAQGAAPRVHAIIVPVIIAVVVLLHVTLGWRTAQAAAAMPAFAGLFAGGAAALSPTLPMVLPASMFPHGPLGALVAGVTVWLGALAAIVILHVVYRLHAGLPVIPVFVVASLAGLVVQGVALTALVAAGLSLVDITWPAIVAVPILVGFVPTLFIAVAAELRLHNLGPRFRRELLRAPPFGSSSLVEEALRAERLYKEGLSEGQAEASTYLELVEGDEEGIYVCDAAGRLTYANQALARVFDRPGEDLTGENVRLLFGQGARRTGPPTPNEQTLVPGAHRTFVALPSGHRRAVEVRVRRGSDGRLHGHVRSLTGELVRRELQRQKRRAEFYLQLLRDTVGEHVARPLERLRALREGERLDRGARATLDEAVQDLEDVTGFLHRIEMLGRLEEIEPVPLDLTALVEDAAERFRARHADRAELVLALPTDTVRVRGAHALEEVVNVLLDNAVRHGDRAHVHVTIRAGRAHDGAWLVSFEDDGPGVPNEVKEQLERPTNGEAVETLGLGLHVARAIVEALGGRLWAEDRVDGEPDQGAVFHLRLAPAPRTIGAWGRDAAGDEAAGASA